MVNRLLKVVKRHLQRQNSTFICFNCIFLGTLLFNFQKFWGEGGRVGLKPIAKHFKSILSLMSVSDFKMFMFENS